MTDPSDSSRKICRTLAFNVGVTGRRRVDEDFVKAKVEEILHGINTALDSPKEFWDGFEGPAVRRIISCLADGTDQIVAKTGLDLGYSLEAVIPFPVDPDPESVHAKDRTEGRKSLDAFSDLYDKARSVLQLNPDYPVEAGWNSVEAECARNRGYERAGFLMLDHCDVLIAVWDGKPCDRPGSTAQVVARAEKMQIPVFIINPRETREPIVVRFHKEPVEIPLQEKGKKWWDQLPCLKSLLRSFSRRKPTDPVELIVTEDLELVFASDDARTQSSTGKRSLRSIRSVRSVVSELLKKPEMRNRNFLSFDLFFVQKERRNIFSRAYNGIWPCFYNWITKKNPLAFQEKSASTPSPPKNDLDAFYQDADSLAIFYANRFRSSFVLSCFLGAAAVTVAAIACCVPWSSKWAIGLGLAELVLIILICTNFFSQRRRRWQQKLTYFRYLAEQLRHFIALRKIGWVIPEVHATQHYSKGEGRSWVRWYLRNITRNIGLPDTDFTTPDMLSTLKREIAADWIDDQAGFHQRTRDRYHRLEWRLTGLTYVLFFFTFAALFSHVVLELPVFAHEQPDLCEKCIVLMNDYHLKPPLLIACSLFTVLFPVWAMAVHALGHYAEAHRMADRSEAMHKQLDIFSERVKQCDSPAELDQIARETAYLMLQEVADWHVQYQMTSPGLA